MAGSDGRTASGSVSARTASIRRASSTVVASGPFSDMPNQSPSLMPAGTTPWPGLMVTRPQLAAGMRREPIPSLPRASGTNPAATAAPLPPEEPPAVRVRSHGLRAVPCTPSVVPKTHSSGTFVRPTTTAPAARSRATVTWSSAAGVSGVAAEPTRLASPRTARLSLTATGTPASGSSARSGREATSSASARAASARTTRNAPTRPSSRSIRARCSATTSRGVARFSRTAAAISAAVRPTQLVTCAPRGAVHRACSSVRVRTRPCSCVLFRTRQYGEHSAPESGPSSRPSALGHSGGSSWTFRAVPSGRSSRTRRSSDHWPNAGRLAPH